MNVLFTSISLQFTVLFNLRYSVSHFYFLIYIGRAVKGTYDIQIKRRMPARGSYNFDLALTTNKNKKLNADQSRQPKSMAIPVHPLDIKSCA